MQKMEVIDLTGEDEAGQVFEKGTVKLIQLDKDPKDDRKLTFDEMLQTAKGLQKCLLTSYVVDAEWLLPKLKNIQNVIICYDDGERHSKPLVTKRGNLTCICPSFPKFPNYGVMHCKLMLLFYFDSLRVVVSTGNLVPYDSESVQNVSFLSSFDFRWLLSKIYRE
jgi:hypothetical protein